MTEAEKHILTAEPRFKPLIDRFGPCELIHPLRGANVYESLMSSILYQQLSTKAATTIKGRLYDLFPTHSAPPPEDPAGLPPRRHSENPMETYGFRRDL